MLSLAGNYGFTYDRRDRAFMPTEGSIVTLGQTLPIVADKTYISNVLGISNYKLLMKI